MRFFEKHNYESVEFLGNFFYKFEVLNEKNSFHYDKIVSTVFYVVRFSHIVFNIGNKRFIIARLTMRCITNCLCVSSAG